MDTLVLREQTPWGELVLRIEGGARPVVRLILEGTFLMDSESVASERALAHRGLARWREFSGRPRAKASPRVLVGGLGFGITLRAALESQAASVVVVELFEPLIGWNRTHLAALDGRALADPRVRCLRGDLIELLASGGPLADPFDLMLLDIGNGPSWLSREENAALYSADGLPRVVVRLNPDGTAVFWATERASDFEACLTQASAAGRIEWGWEEVAAEPARGQRVPPDILYWVGRTS